MPIPSGLTLRCAQTVALAGLVVACAAPSAPTVTTPGSPSPGSTPSASIVSPTPQPGTSTPTAAASPSAAAAQRIEIPGGPLGLDVADGHAWVVATDAGRLVDVDLASGTTTSMDIGPSVNWVKVLDGRLVVSRYGTAPGRGMLEIVDPADGRATPVYEQPLDGLDVEGNTIWAFAKGGTVLQVDADGRIVRQVPVEIVQNEHIDLVGLGDAAFASSDSTPVRRVAGAPLAVVATIETGGGVPFVEDRGLVWGARGEELWVIDPAAGQVKHRFPLTDVDEILDLDVEGDDAWIAVRHPGRIGAVLRVDLATGNEVADVPAELPAAVVIAGDRVWVTDYEADALLVFDR